YFDNPLRICENIIGRRNYPPTGSKSYVFAAAAQSFAPLFKQTAAGEGNIALANGNFLLEMNVI
ncbi:MAG: hypothetical protein WCD24_07820, partial [Serratia inhibens]|uniref:hypothetical protein n=1 Tax=Serratia inhibens TaxID=2338073 RepID=UPI003C7A0869